MKIISKFKDYYDFVVFDPDAKNVYDRKTLRVVDQQRYDNYKKHNEIAELNNSIPGNPDHKKEFWNNRNSYSGISSEDGHFVMLAFCGKLYQIFNTPKGNFIYSPKEFLAAKIKIDKHKYSYRLGKRIINYTEEDLKKDFFEIKETNINKLYKCPVVLHDLVMGITLNPKLSDLQFHKLFTAEQCYQELYNWISEHYPEPKMPSSPDDMSRYEAKGFDKKTSFRNIK